VTRLKSCPSRGELQAIARLGGARVECVAETLVSGGSAGDSGAAFSIVCAKAAAAGDCGLAHCGVVTARQQSWLQQPVVRAAIWVDSVAPESWQRCALRIQQAWSCGAVAASATGTKFPASANNRSSLAIRRCMLSGELNPKCRKDRTKARTGASRSGSLGRSKSPLLPKPGRSGAPDDCHFMRT
jgi:hypothetical protein